jgi:threonine dehydrogenase-like Zn-dependent dehydrogenase
MPSPLTLSDVMGTGHHAALAAQVAPGHKVAVVGDGAVGLCGVIAAKRLGAEQIILLGRHDDRVKLGRDFGATDIVAERDDDAIASRSAAVPRPSAPTSRNCCPTYWRAGSSQAVSSTAQAHSKTYPRATGR